MGAILKIFFGPMQPLVSHPERAYMIAGAFAVLIALSIFSTGGFKPRIHVPMLGTALLWVLFGLNEYNAMQKGWNIRVDLLLFWPILLVMSIGSVWRGVRCIVGRTSKDGNANRQIQPIAGRPGSS